MKQLDIKQVAKKMLGPRNSYRIRLLKEAFLRWAFRTIRTISNHYDSSQISLSLPEIIYSSPTNHVFFGYYEVPQFNHDENKLLATMVSSTNKTLGEQEEMWVGYYDLREESPKFKIVGSTNTWCWQQGCRLQWYPNAAIQSIIFNTIIENKYGSVIQNIDNGKIIKTFHRPIYAISNDGRWGLSLNFSRLQRLRPGYGYNKFADSSTNDSHPCYDGIWRINLNTGTEKLLFSVRDIAEVEPCPEMNGAQHYFNHLLFNPAGDRFMFFHIWQEENGRRKIRMLTSGINGSNIRLLNNSGYVSHYCWKNDHQLLAYAAVADHGTGYYLFDDFSGKSRLIGKGSLTADGHPSFLPDKHHLITDTYPDKYGEQKLMMYNYIDDRLNVLTKEFSPLKFTDEIRCDLHPRLSPSGRFVSIDCIINGRRAIKLFDISSLVMQAF